MSWIRLVLATVLIVFSWYIYDVVRTDSFEVAPAAIMFYLVIYFFLVTLLRVLISILHTKRVLEAVFFMVMFTGLHFALFFFGYSGYDFYSLGGKAIVVGGKFTAFGWSAIFYYTLITIFIGAVAAAILFARKLHEKNT